MPNIQYSGIPFSKPRQPKNQRFGWTQGLGLLTNRTTILITLVGCLIFNQHTIANTEIEDFFSPSDYQRVRLAPDGKHFAIKANIDGAGRLVIFETEGVKPVVIFKTEKRREVGAFWWANKERLVFTQNYSSGSFDYPLNTGELFALNIDDSKKFAIAGWAAGDPRGAFNMLHPMPDNKRMVRVVRRGIKNRAGTYTARPIAFALDTYKTPRSSTGTNLGDKRFKQKVTSPYPWGSFVADNSGKVRIAFYTSEKGVLEISQLTNKNKWEPMPEFSPDADKLLRGLDNPILGFDSEDKGIYYLAQGQHQTAALFHYDLDSSVRTPLFESKQFDVSESLLIHSSDGAVIGVTLLGTYPETHFFSDHSDVKLMKQIVGSFPYQLVGFSNFSEDGRYVLVETHSDQNPGMLYLFDQKAGGLRPLMQARSRIEPKQMKQREPFQLTTKDGLDLYGFITLPNAEAKNSPTVVIAHGGPHGVFDTFLFDSEAQYFASQGYAVIQVNFRGSGGYGTKVLEAGVGQWAKGMITDITDATAWAVQQKLSDPERVCIYGGSYGAFAALSAVSQYPDIYQCAIGIAGVYDLSELKLSDISFIPWGKKYLDYVLGDDEQALKNQSPVYNAANIKVPVFIAHGGEDQRAPVAHANAMYKALTAVGNTPKWLLYPDEGHGFSDAEHRYEYYEQLTEFLAESLGKR